MKIPKLLLLSAFVAAMGVVIFLPKDAMAEAAPTSFDGFQATCIGTILDECKVLSAGYLNKDDGSFDLAFQTQGGSTVEDGSIGSILLYHYADGAWAELAEAHDAYRYSPPVITDTGLLHVAGYTSGTGSFNADLLFTANEAGTAWQAVDVDTWHDHVADMLPKGLAIWKGVRYDFNNWELGPVAYTSLWREDDANCCATGGEATLVFKIVDQVLTLDNVIYTEPKKTK